MANRRGTGGTDVLTGTGRADRIEGLGGADWLYGLGGNDVYIFSGQFGADQVYDEAGRDTLWFKTLKKDDVRYFVPPTGTSLLIIAGESGNFVTTALGTAGQRVETALFRNGRVDLTDGLTLTGTAGDDRMGGTAKGDVLIGLAGDDTMDGGSGNDTYLFRGTFDNDTVTDSSGARDRLWLPDADRGDVRLFIDVSSYGVRNDLQVIRDDGASVTLPDHVTAPTVEQLALRRGSIDLRAGLTLTGTAGEDDMGGTAFADQLTGREGEDTLDGGSGNDTYVFRGAFGTDTVTDSSGARDRLWMPDAEKADVRLLIDVTSFGGRNHLHVISETGSVILDDHLNGPQVETLVLKNGRIDLTGGLSLTGSDGDDRMGGTNGNDTLRGAGGDDGLFGRNGRDVFVFDAASGNDSIGDFADGVDRIRLLGGLTFTDVVATQDRADVLLEFGSASVVIEDIDVASITAADFIA